jgi:hypothetical protein
VPLLPSPSQFKPGLGAQVNPSHPLARGLAGCWLLNEGSGSRLTNSAPAYYGAAGSVDPDVAWVPGLHGPALDWPIDDKLVNVGNQPQLNLATRFTCEAWVRRDRDQSGAFAMIFMRGKDANTGWATYVSSDHNHAFLKAAVAAVFSVTPSVLGEWEHVVWVVDGTAQPALYLGGRRMAGVDANTSGILASTEDARIGTNLNNIGLEVNTWQGQISLVRVWDRELADGEIKWLFDEPFGMLEQSRAWHRAYAWTHAFGAAIRRLPVTTGIHSASGRATGSVF